MAKVLHPKILELRNKVGIKPIHEFWPSQKKYEAVPMEKRAIKTSTTPDSREIDQYFAIWGVPDDYGTQPEKGCFKKSINERGPNTNATNKIVVLNQHNQRSPLCIPTKLEEDEIGFRGVYTPDPDIEENDTLVKRVKRGTINGGSYGFNYVWDKMEFDDKTGIIHMFECETFEISPVVLASQGGTFVVRGKDGEIIDEFLEEETEELIKKVSRKHQLELRSLIARHISLAQSQPVKETTTTEIKSSRSRKPIDLDYLLENLKL